MKNTDDPVFIYVCSPYGGMEENYKRALFYGQYVVQKGYIPIIPHTMLHGILNDKLTSERNLGIKTGQGLLKMCKEVWVFGKLISPGMNGEIYTAGTVGIPIKYIEDTFALSDNNAAISLIVNRYQDATGCLANRIILDDVIGYLNSGISDKLIIEAIEITGRKNCRWNYTRAILNRCLSQEVLTVEKFRERCGTPQQSDSYAAYDMDAFENMLNSK